MEESEDGTFGALLLNGKVFCVTLEPPDRNNAPNISNIPPGQYIAKRATSPLVQKITKGKHKDTFEITNIPGRAKVLFHPGNTVADTQGCVLLGQYWDKLKGDRAVLNSGATFDKFMERLAGVSEFSIVVLDPYTRGV
jgi:hypothetical protein